MKKQRHTYYHLKNLSKKELPSAEAVLFQKTKGDVFSFKSIKE